MPRKQTIWKKNNPHNQRKAVLENVKREFRQKSNAELYEWLLARGMTEEQIPLHRKDRIRVIVASFDAALEKRAKELKEQQQQQQQQQEEGKDKENESS